jgi:VanZ family protein
MKKFFKFWFPVLIWAGFIFWLSSIPNLKSGLEQDFILRKIAHILEYAILTFLFLRALTKENLSIGKIVISSIVFSLFYALTDEYHQTFIFGREGSLGDVGINSIGILITAGIWYIKSIGEVKLPKRPMNWKF